MRWLYLCSIQSSVRKNSCISHCMSVVLVIANVHQCSYGRYVQEQNQTQQNPQKHKYCTNFYKSITISYVFVFLFFFFDSFFCIFRLFCLKHSSNHSKLLTNCFFHSCSERNRYCKGKQSETNKWVTQTNSLPTTFFQKQEKKLNCTKNYCCRSNFSMLRTLFICCRRFVFWFLFHFSFFIRFSYFFRRLVYIYFLSWIPVDSTSNSCRFPCMLKAFLVKFLTFWFFCFSQHCF